MRNASGRARPVIDNVLEMRIWEDGDERPIEPTVFIGVPCPDINGDLLAVLAAWGPCK